MFENILNFLLTIPKWKVISYKYLWDKFGIHQRKVAFILKNNFKQDIYPCYKVVNKNWKLGWYNLWLKEKIIRLEKDWIIIKQERVLKEFFYEN